MREEDEVCPQPGALWETCGALEEQLLPGSGGETLWSYWVVEEQWYRPELGWYPTCGLQVCRMTAEVRRMWGILHDVAVERRLVQELAARFCRCGLSPTHLRDVVEDLLP